ncbi:multidrug resistance-associated ABC transporter [Coniophora puteana RWD-64-598 SS2]|uniref:Multidrug resistance-associated ABC transporter n=1 Tax=Coniophora puteana (strain RWD-64-598) TaxID=741705 RepID=A0A5M3MHE5_CONPW|nr:multidrug resistance-associated ABC transporter [Coniophora puteana RWD-64-598 SS2]EIW78632.1 multidrug resistance-associated ABC transporter [Coniophora puteana RWD-64-598 SS2]
MPPYQLPMAAAALVGVAGSILMRFVTREKEGKIKLPSTGDDALGSEAKAHDPFDVVLPEDLIDGYPVEEDEYWAQMRLWKVSITANLVVILALETVSLGWAAAALSGLPTGGAGTDLLLVYLFRTLYALYTVTLAAGAVPLTTVRLHRNSVIHLAVLTALAFALQFAISILPISALSPAGSSAGALRALWHATLVLYALSAALSWTIPTGPPLRFPPERVYAPATNSKTSNKSEDNVSGSTGASVLDFILFSYTTRLVRLVQTAESLEIGDLPILPANMRATFQFHRMRELLRVSPIVTRGKGKGDGKDGGKKGTRPGWGLAWRVLRVNGVAFVAEMIMTALAAPLWFASPFFLQKLIAYLESDPERLHTGWGWVYAIGQLVSLLVVHMLAAQFFSLATAVIAIRIKAQLNTILFEKTLVRKDIVSSAGSSDSKEDSKDAKGKKDSKDSKDKKAKKNKDKDGDEDEEAEFSSKAQVMTLMTTDVDRVSEFSFFVFSLVDSPIELVVGTLLLYRLIGVSCFWGLLVIVVMFPFNTLAGKVVVRFQDELMKARDERVALMNEVLGAIRMLKFMAWERPFESRILRVRERELKYQKLNYWLEVIFAAIWDSSPLIVTLVAFWHFSVWRGEALTPSIAFPTILVFQEMRFAFNALPETFVNMLQSFVSLRRIEHYLELPEITPVPPLDVGGDGAVHVFGPPGERQGEGVEGEYAVACASATVTWPQDRSGRGGKSGASTPFAPSTPGTPGGGQQQGKFVLLDMDLRFPAGELSLVCGKLGSGKTLLLLALLGEADVLAGQVVCPRSPPDSLAVYGPSGVNMEGREGEWVVPGMCAYVPQSAWLRNASIKDNILFSLPYDEERYQRTLEACALIADLNILEDGDESEIGERGVNLSGGQKARVSLARAVYSRASILLLDDVLSAVDAHTAHHLYHECIKGDLMRGRTVVLVSHHVQLCSSGAAYVVALDNGRVAFAGDRQAFLGTSLLGDLGSSGAEAEEEEEKLVEDSENLPSGSTLSVLKHVGESTDVGALASSQQETEDPPSETSSTAFTEDTASATANGTPNGNGKAKLERKPPRKLIEEEKRAVGRVSKDVWAMYVRACGKHWYWSWFALVLVLAALSPIAESYWLKSWSGAPPEETAEKGPVYYIGVYAALTLAGVFLSTYRYFVLYSGSIQASTVLYKRLLESVLFANIRFHDTVSRGRLLNRFGKDFEGIDSRLSDHFGRSIIFALAFTTILVSIAFAGGIPFVLAAFVLGYFCFTVAKLYSQASRDMRRLDSVARSPLYSLYGETIAGATVLRAFGASSKFLRDMLTCVDTQINPSYWQLGVNRWISARYDLLASVTVGLVGIIAVMTPSISAALAGFALSFATQMTLTLLFLVRRFVGLEQSMVALERIKEYSELAQESPEFVEPRPAASWPDKGAIKCEDLVIRYAPQLPNVLHNINFEVRPGEKVGILGRTGSGKSTLALSFFRFVEATEGRILVDGVDIGKIGLTDLRSKLTIIPQDPTILSGTLRSTLDVFDEYEDAEIYEALRRVHLIPSSSGENTEAQTDIETPETINVNVFRNLESPVSEGGENFSTGEKQLLCMARAILKRSKVLVMDEATASVDYATDELIGKTIRQEFANSTILTIAHRLRTVIDYDRVMLLDQGRIVEFDSPAILLADPESQFHSLCKATGKNEFATLKRMAGL